MLPVLSILIILVSTKVFGNLLRNYFQRLNDSVLTLNMLKDSSLTNVKRGS